MKTSWMLLLAFCWAGEDCLAASLKSGPLLGAASMSEVKIWVQTDAEAAVSIRYWRLDDSEAVFETVPISVRSEDNYIAHCLADQVVAGQRYGYEVCLDGEVVPVRFPTERGKEGLIPLVFQTPVKWRHRLEDNMVPPDFRLATGSCANIYEEGYGWEYLDSAGGDYQIFEAIHAQSPDLMLWLGDNIYLAEEDWTSRSGFFHRYDHMRSQPYLRALHATTHHYATWDDHDYGPNNAGREFWNKDLAREMFALYWANPSYGTSELPGIATFFNWADVNFYLLDNRFFRVSENNQSDLASRSEKPHFGYPQIDWLLDSLIYWKGQSDFVSPVSFHVIVAGGQFLSDDAHSDSLAKYPEEWNYLMARLKAEQIEGVVFLSGDVHRSELLDFREPLRAVELTVSPFTSSPNPYPSKSSGAVDLNPASEAKAIHERNFAILDFKGPLEQRVMEIRMFNAEGELINQKPGAAAGEIPEAHIIRAADLKYPESGSVVNKP